MTDVTEKMLTGYIQKLCAEQESLIARFLAETKLKPSEIALVEQATENGRVFYPEKADRLQQIQKLNERITTLSARLSKAVELIEEISKMKRYKCEGDRFIDMAKDFLAESLPDLDESAKDK